MERFFIVMSLVWLIALGALVSGWSQPGFVIFVSYALNSLGCLVMSLSYAQGVGSAGNAGGNSEGGGE